VITLGSRSFSGPYMLPLWSRSQSAVRQGGLFAVMVPGWRLLTFRAIYFGQAAEFSLEMLEREPRYEAWLRIAGTDWNLYVAIHEMAASTHTQREAAAAAIAREYRPQFTRPVATQE
jgi:hypothetical protein